MAAPADIFRNALLDLGRMGIGESAPSAPDLALCLSHYNRLVSRWSAQGKMSYYERNQAFTFSVSQQSYSIGVTANSPDFTITAPGGVRPPFINRAKLVLTASSPNSELDIPVIFKQVYESINTPEQIGVQPYCVYYQPTFPNGTLWPVPYPTNTSNKLRLFWPAQLEVIAIADIATDIPMPPALEDALTWTLEERLCVPFSIPVSDELRIQANGARQVYSQLNDSDPALISTDIQGRGSPYDNYWFRSRGHE